MNGRDAESLCVLGSAHSDYLARNRQRAGIGLVGPRKDLDQRALSRAVLSNQCVHFAGHEVEVHML